LQALQASECMWRSSHNFVVFFSLQTTPTVSEVLRSRTTSRSLPPSPVRRMLTQRRRRTVAVHRRWDWSL